MGFKRVIGGSIDALTFDLTDFDGRGSSGAGFLKRFAGSDDSPTTTDDGSSSGNDSNSNTDNSPGNNKRTARQRVFPHPKVMGYPLSRGQKERTGDSLLIKCFEYVPSQIGITGERGVVQVNNDGRLLGQDYAKNDLANGKDGKAILTLMPGTAKLKNKGASDRVKKEKHIYYIELPIPQDVNDANTVTWGDDNMNIFQLAGLQAANTLIKDGVNFQDMNQKLIQGFFNQGEDGLFGGIDESTQNAVRAAIGGKAINALGGQINTNSAIGRAEGMILNSNLELLFSAVNLRTFPFSINFSPRNPAETRMVKHIIRALKMSMAAKKSGKFVEAEGQGGVFLRSPDIFTLKYLHNGVQHPFLNNFKPVALTGMNVNYTNSGTYTTYGDGTPVSIRMNLTFKELNPIYHEDYEEFGENDGLGVGF